MKSNLVQWNELRATLGGFWSKNYPQILAFSSGNERTTGLENIAHRQKKNISLLSCFGRSHTDVLKVSFNTAMDPACPPLTPAQMASLHSLFNGTSPLLPYFLWRTVRSHREASFTRFPSSLLLRLFSRKKTRTFAVPSSVVYRPFRGIFP